MGAGSSVRANREPNSSNSYRVKEGGVKEYVDNFMVSRIDSVIDQRQAADFRGNPNPNASYEPTFKLYGKLNLGKKLI
jgi:hypothetical protein